MNKNDRYGATNDTYADTETGSTIDTETDTDSETRQSVEDKPERTQVNDSSAESSSSTSSADAPDMDLPFIFARRTVKADREALPVYIQEETAGRITEAERRLEEQFTGDKLMSLDVREALLVAGLENIDDVEWVMRQWGYGRR